MEPAAEPDPMALPHAVHGFSVASVELHHAMAARIGITPQDLAALTHLSRDGPLTPHELGERLKLRKASVTSVVDRLESRGHAVRKPHTSDRRSTLVEATADGIRECLDVLDPVVAAVRSLGAELTAEQYRTAVELLRRCTDAMIGCADATHPPAR